MRCASGQASPCYHRGSHDVAGNRSASRACPPPLPPFPAPLFRWFATQDAGHKGARACFRERVFGKGTLRLVSKSSASDQMIVPPMTEVVMAARAWPIHSRKITTWSAMACAARPPRRTCGPVSVIITGGWRNGLSQRSGRERTPAIANLTRQTSKKSEFPAAASEGRGRGKGRVLSRCTEGVKALHTQKLAGVCTLEQDELARGKLRRQDHPALVEGVFRNHVSGRTPDAPAPIHRSDVHRNVSSSGDQLLEVLAVWQVAELTPPPWTGAAPQGRRMLD